MRAMFWRVSRVPYPVFCSVTASGPIRRPAAARSSALALFPNTQRPRVGDPETCATLRVTVSLQILFGKYAEKISPDPP
jgi:hypothetical protein